MVDQTFKVDITKPLVFQVGLLGKAYDEWCHQPTVSKESPRFFGNAIMEFFTRTAWWVIPIVWLPVVCLFASYSIEDGLPLHYTAATLVAGVIIWTLLEYLLHRFLFHIQTTSYWGNTVHFLLHGCHHKHPMDSLRLVFPPAAAALFAVPIWFSMKLLFPALYAPALFAGFVLGYVIYDCTHYYLHHGKPSKGFSNGLKRFHMTHHYKIQDKGFGITSDFWDRVFGTLPPQKKTNKKDS